MFVELGKKVKHISVRIDIKKKFSCKQNIDMHYFNVYLNGRAQ